MPRKAEGYWERRQTALMLNIERKSNKTINQLISSYNIAKNNIQKEIKNIFNKYATDGKLTIKEAKELLNTKESKAFYENLLNNIKMVKDKDIKRELLSKYNAPAYNYRIARYQALQDNINVELAKLMDKEKVFTQSHYVNTIKDGYYHTIFNAQQYINVGFNFSELDQRTINLLLNEKWSNKGNFSTRIYNNNQKLANYLSRNMLPDYISGKAYNKIAQELDESINIGLYNATRLIRTEVNHFANEAEMLAYEELGIEKYKFVATLDKVTCVHCSALDNKVFYVKDRKPGKNYPPIHPNDRCTTVAEFDEEVTQDLKRRARNEDRKSILLPQDTNYNQWYNNLNYNNKTSTKDEKDGKINNNSIIQALNMLKIEYNPVKKLEKTLTIDEIVNKISGGDLTNGSCASLGFTYIANKNGLDVIDFRGGESQDFFSTRINICKIAQLPGVKGTIEENYNDIMGTMNLLKSAEEGKEYLLATGEHAAIIRKINNKYQFLELQSPKENGFKTLTNEILKKRFRCKQTHSVQGIKLKAKNILIEVDSFKDNDEFKEIVGYINTPKNKQIKGVNGNEK